MMSPVSEGASHFVVEISTTSPSARSQEAVVKMRNGTEARRLSGSHHVVLKTSASLLEHRRASFHVTPLMEGDNSGVKMSYSEQRSHVEDGKAVYSSHTRL